MGGEGLRSLLLAVVSLLLLFSAGIAFAQEAGEVTDDMVNAIARKMYCPVCPNEPLDTCMTQACMNWRGEIRAQLEAGRTEAQIVADFVSRYGERASSTPLDPTLRGLSVYVPWLIAGLALAIGLVTLWRWQRGRRLAVPAAPPLSASPGPDDDYRAALERDVKR